MKNKLHRLTQAKEDFKPLYKKEDKFKIVKLNTDKDLMPIEALHLKSNQVYGFEEGELEQ